MEQRLETQPLDLGHVDRRSLAHELQGICARTFRHDSPLPGPDAIRARTRARSSSARNGFVKWSVPPTCIAVIRSRTSPDELRLQSDKSEGTADDGSQDRQRFDP